MPRLKRFGLLEAARALLHRAWVVCLVAMGVSQLALAMPSFDPFADATAEGGTSYAVGSALTNQSNPSLPSPWYSRGTVAPGSQPMIVTGNLSYPNLPASAGNSVAFVPAANQSTCLNLNVPTGSPDMVYCSYLLKITDLANVPAYPTNNPFAAFMDDPAPQSGQIARLGCRVLTKKVGSGFVLGTSRSGTTADFVYEPDANAHSVGDVLFVVQGFQRNGTTETNVLLWVNPDPATFGTGTPPAPTVTALTGNAGINNNGARAFGILCQFLSAPSGVIDDVRAAKSWATVTGAPDMLVQPTNQTANATSNVTFAARATGSGPLSYQWKKDGADLHDGPNIAGASTATLTLSNVLQADAAGYAVLVSNARGSVASATATLTVNDPFITTQPTNQTVTVGGTATFRVAALGTPTLTYQWYKNSAPLSDDGRITGSQTVTLTLHNFATDDAGTYYVLVSNGLGSSVQSANVLLRASDPSIVAQPQSLTNVYGTTATFQVTASGTGPFTYQWHKEGVGNLSDGGNISGSLTSTLTLSGVSLADSGTYWVTVANGLGSVDSAPAVLTVRDPAITVQPSSTTNLAGATATFHVVAVGSGGLTYMWQKNGSIIFDNATYSGTSTDTLTLSGISTADEGSYSVMVIGGSGNSETSSNATLTIAAPISITYQPTSRTVAAGARTALAAWATGTTPSFQWQHYGTNLPGATSFSYVLNNVQPEVTGEYRVIIANQYNSQTSSVAVVQIASPLYLSETNLVVMRIGDGAHGLSANGNWIFLDQFATNGGYVNTVSVPDSGPYALLAIGPNVVSLGGSATSITGNGLSRSADGAHLLIGGYNTNLSYNAPLASSPALAVPRGIGLFDARGQYTLPIASTNAFNNTIWRGALSDGTNSYWGWGRTSGTYYFGYDAPGGVSLQSLWVNLRSMGLFNETIYCVSAVANNNGVMKLDRLPTGVVTPTVLIASGSTGSSDCDVSPDGNTIYLADDRVASNGGGVHKYHFDGASWVEDYVLADGLPNGARYLAVDFQNHVVYAVTTENDNNQLVAIPDQGAGSTGTVLARSGVNQNFRGIRFGPRAQPASAPLLSASSDGNNLVLNWQGSFFLQSAANVAGPYSDVINGMRPYTNQVHSASQGFFRLRQ